MTVKQIRSVDGTGTLSYLVLDAETRSGVLIDPNIEDTQVIASVCKDAGAHVTRIIDTHTHADHISGAGELKKMFEASIVMHENTKNKWKIIDQGDKFGIGDILRANAAIPIDRYVRDGDTLQVGSLSFNLLFTPGHTDNHVSISVGDALFTGDLLLIGQAGRSDLPGGDPGQQYDSLFKKILPLPDHVKMYPGHDYDGHEFSYLGDEKRNNPFLQPRSKEEYLTFVSEFFPPLAEASATGGKMTLQCGTQRVVQPSEGIKNISVDQLAARLQRSGSLVLLDVREPFELMMSGAIEGVVNIPVGQLSRRFRELPEDKTVEVICLCQSGSRSVEAAHFLRTQGYTNVSNLDSGTSGWIRKGFKVVRPGVHA